MSQSVLGFPLRKSVHACSTPSSQSVSYWKAGYVWVAEETEWGGEGTTGSTGAGSPVGPKRRGHGRVSMVKKE